MKPAAKSIDMELARDLRARSLSGSVLSLHDKVIYLARDDGGLVVVAREDVGNGPGVVLVEYTGSLKGLSAGMRPGVSFGAREDAIDIGRESVRIGLSGAEPWDPALGAMRAAAPEKAGEAVRAAARTALESDRRTPLAALFDGRGDFSPPPGEKNGNSPAGHLRRRILSFAAALRGRRKETVIAAARALVGAGGGLTPAGDDVLVGVIGYLLGAGDEGRRETAAWIAGAIREAEGRTNPVSRHFLREACRGRFTSRVKSLIEAVFSGDEKKVEPAARAVLEYGSSSGAELIFGVCMAHYITT